MRRCRIPAEVATVLEGSFRKFESELARTSARQGADEVHDVRVSIRRLEQALELFGRWLPRTASAAVASRIKQVLKRAGDVRDRDIALHLIVHLELDVDPSIRPVLESGRDAAALRLKAAAGKLTAPDAIGAWMTRLRLDRREPVAALAALAAVALPGLARAFIESGADLAAHAKSRKRLHRFRVSAKRFRYSMEFLSNVYGPDIEDRVQTVRKVQTALGDLQDCVATRALLREAGVPKGALAPLRAEEKKRVRDFRELWPKLFDARAGKEWTAYLEHPHRRVARASR